MRILTGIDLPYGSPGGSVELLRDLYLEPGPLVPADTFMLAPADGTAVRTDSRLSLLSVDGKALSGAAFRAYVDTLSTAIATTFGDTGYDVLHLQHLTFGATPALARAFPRAATIALVHGTDLLFAAEHQTQARVLRETAASADAVVVPTTAMADRLRRIAPVTTERIVHIPWGVPDHLLEQPPARSGGRPDALRVLYAGRLTAEKATAGLLSAVAGLDGIELGVAAPPHEYAKLSERTDLSHIHYLGWLSRERLWHEFGRHDLLIAPSLKLEAFGLVTIEAQACGLPVAYQPVPGLAEVLGESALPVDFADLTGLAARLEELHRTRTLLDDLTAAGRVNSRRFPLSRTARELTELSSEVAR
ncbi:glycosyltransferase family 4 protein [Streptomyces sp. JJ38]|uniref:glycosyltransferase family 4 protein n=1 Tax=Streptomyces sp. JJ38 TaxID=2738128 RepID=UPI0027E028B1|nr:glycosyltransferase family 4 protein [Streptomyces sp. JJ38]